MLGALILVCFVGILCLVTFMLAYFAVDHFPVHYLLKSISALQLSNVCII